jgi:hypothetical protein
MKTCLECGAMISPYPMHRDESGLCDECGGNNPVENNRPKIKGKHMIICKTQEEKDIAMRQRSRFAGRSIVW